MLYIVSTIAALYVVAVVRKLPHNRYHYPVE